jgi:hypothetical protein
MLAQTALWIPFITPLILASSASRLQLRPVTRYGTAARCDEPPDILSAEEIKQLRYNLAHLSPDGVRQFYERVFGERRLVYARLPSPRKMQTLVQVWKQLWKWRR